jgi:hypothetical protein
VAMVAILAVFNWLDRQKQRTKHHSWRDSILLYNIIAV